MFILEGDKHYSTDLIISCACILASKLFIFLFIKHDFTKNVVVIKFLTKVDCRHYNNHYIIFENIIKQY